MLIKSWFITFSKLSVNYYNGSLNVAISTHKVESTKQTAMHVYLDPPDNCKTNLKVF